MNAATVAALRELLGREDVIEAGTVAAWNHTPAIDPTLREVEAGVRAAFAAVLELAAGLPSFPPPPVLSTITDDERGDHPQPGDEPSAAVPDGVDGFALPPRIRVDPDLRTAP